MAYHYLHLHKDSRTHQGFRVPIREYVQLLSRHLRTHTSLIVALCAFMAAGIALQLINPQIIRGFIDSARDGTPTSRLIGQAILFLGIALLTQLFRIASSYFGQVVAWKSTNRLREEVAEHCLHLDMKFHNTHSAGELIERIDDDIALLSNFFSQFAVELAGSLVFALGVVCVLFAEDWRLGLVFLVYALVALFVLLLMRDIAIPARMRFQKVLADQSSYMQENLSALEDIRAIGAAGRVLHSYKDLIRRLQIRGEISNVFGQIMVNGSNIMFSIGTAVAFFLGAWFFLRGSISIGTVYLISHYVALLVRPLQRVSREIQSLQSAGAAITRTQELMNETSAVTGGSLDKIIKAPKIEMKKLSFAYEKGRNVLTDINLTIEAGHVVGLLGRTGSGKTTLGRLLFRFYESGEGSIEIDGVPADHYEIETLRKSIGLVTQEVQLFRATLRDNITFFDHTVEDNTILEVLRELRLQRWYDSLPSGLDTFLGADGRSLSSGESQLVALTRVFLSDPKIIILDEASSRLDPATEQYLETSIDRLTKGRTCIIIAHRLATILRADDILILSDGRIVERGARDELAKNPVSRFASLLKSGLEEVLE